MLVRSDAEREQVGDILEEFNPVDLHDETTAGIGGATRISPEVRSSYAARSADQVRAEAAGTSEHTEQVIPVVRESWPSAKRRPSGVIAFALMSSRHRWKSR